MSAGLIISSLEISSTHSLIAVSTKPGQRAVACTPVPASSPCAACVNPIKPALAAE